MRGSAEYRAWLQVIDRQTAIDELAALRASLRVTYGRDPKLERLERMIDGRMHEILDDVRDGRAG